MPLKAPSFKAQVTASGLGIRELTREEIRKRRAEERGQMQSMKSWAVLVPERGVKLDLPNFPYQEEWYSERVAQVREAVWMKAAQVGMSAYAWRWAARRAEQFNDTCIYFFPTDDDVTEFGDKRIEPSIQDSAYLLKRIPPGYVRHKHLKQIGGGWLALRGTQSKAAVQSVDADALVFDEYDYLHPGNLEQAERRIAGAKAAGREPRIRRFGYPTMPGFGIHAEYKRSDQRRWFVTCPECGTEQPITWKDNVRWRSYEDGDVLRMGRDDYEEITDVHEAWRACKDCEASLEGDGGPIYTGRWVATNPSSAIVGYHVPRLIVPRTDLIELVRNSRKTSPTAQEAFWNNDLGEPYSPAESSLTEEDVKACMAFGDEMASHYRGRNVVIGGLDVASERDLTLWIDQITPTGEVRALYVAEVLDFEEAAQAMLDYKVNLLVVDSMPERRQARALAATFPGRVILAAYDDRNEADAFKYDPKKNMVTVNRTEAIDALFDSVRHQRRALPRNPPKRFISQLTSPKRRTEESPTTGKRKRVYVATGPDGDDYAHAGVYVLVAKELWELKRQVEAATAAKRGRPLSNQRRGFRVRGDEYVPGFGENV